MRTVLIVLFEGVQSLDVTGPLEVFNTANRWRVERDAAPGYAITTASLGGAAVRTTSGLGLLPDADLASVGDGPDLMVVPGGAGARRRDPDLVGWLRRNAPRARRLASVCTGAFLLAEAGLLTGRTVTTHWERCDDLAGQYPDVTVDPDPIFIKDGNLATSAGVTAGIDLALALVEDDLGRDAALAVARQLVVFLRRPGSQSQFSAQLSAQVAERQPLREVQQWICRSRPWPNGPACRRASSPAPSPPRPAFRPAGTSTWPGWRPRAATWRTPAGVSSRPPAPAATAPPRRCAAPSSAPSASARPSTAADSARPPQPAKNRQQQTGASC